MSAKIQPPPTKAAKPTNSRQNLALIISQGVSCAKLRRMAQTGIDACFPQQFAINAYKYNDEGRVAYTNGNGCLIWVKIRSLGILPQGIYVHGEIFKAKMGATQTCDGLYGGFSSKHRKHPAAQLIREGTEIQFVHRGAMAEGPVYSLRNQADGTAYTPYIPEDLGTSEDDQQLLISTMVPLYRFTSSASTITAAR